MGYYIEVKDINWHINYSKVDKIEKEILKYSKKHGIKWIDTEDLKKAKKRNFLDFLRILDLESIYNNGFVSILGFNRCKIGDEKVIFSIFAKYSFTDSYIVFKGEQGEKWMWKVSPTGELNELYSPIS